MESTDAPGEQPLGPQHLAGCLELSRRAHWNQNAADWQWMLGFGRGYGLTLADGTLAASTITLPYSERFAWISMVLVLPEHRRKGYATRLLRHALDDLQAEGRAAVLDATPAGREVYAHEGFHDTWGFRRYEARALRDCAESNAGPRVRPLTAQDWPGVLALDARAFGASRQALLRSLTARLPAASLVAERDGALAGFIVGRDGREASQLGPLVACDADAAMALLDAALERVPAPLFLDVVDREDRLRAWLEARGFEFQRPFTRMVQGSDRAPGEQPLIFCPAGAELG
jgi:GNAT superfamily N-acetyltransferase